MKWLPVVLSVIAAVVVATVVYSAVVPVFAGVATALGNVATVK